MADTLERLNRAKKLLYIFKKYFATTLLNIKSTDLIVHAIDLKSNSRSIYYRPARYTIKKRKFVTEIFPKIEEAEILIRENSD